MYTKVYIVHEYIANDFSPKFVEPSDINNASTCSSARKCYTSKTKRDRAQICIALSKFRGDFEFVNERDGSRIHLVNR